MHNKIKEERAQGQARLAANRQHRTQRKITELIVQRMLRKTQELELETHSSDFLAKVLPRSAYHHPQPHKQSVSFRRDGLRTEQGSGRRGRGSGETRKADIVGKGDKGWYVEPDLQWDSMSKLAQRVKNYRILPDRSEQFNRLIAERMKNMAKISIREQLLSQEGSPHQQLSFGLSITQIKANQQIKAIHTQIKANRTQASLSQTKNISSHQMDSRKIKNHIPRPKDKPRLFSLRKTGAEAGYPPEETPLVTLCPTQFEVESPQAADLPQKHRHSGSKDIDSPQRGLNQKELMVKKFEETSFKKCRGTAKEQDGTILQKKLLRMAGCLDLILNSYHCRLLPLSSPCSDPRRDRQKYSYYVGPGNNSNLVRSLLRKRGWWTEVDCPRKAHLVWTQLRLPAVLERLESQQDSEENFEPYEEMESQQQRSQFRESNKGSSSPGASESRAAESWPRQLFHQRQSKRYQAILEGKEVDVRLQSVPVPKVLHNHYEHNYMFGNKNALYYNLSAYCQFSGRELTELVPLTFYLERDNRREMAEFEKAHQARKGATWIVKPAENSNRGQGIEVTTSLPFIKSRVSAQKKVIVQAYLGNPLLYQGRKFDIRTYMIASTVNGRTKFYWYEEGYVRTSSEPYDPHNLRDRFIHLTNDAVQNHSDNYGLHEDGNKLSYNQLQRYLDSRFPKENWSVLALHGAMKQSALEAVRATYCRIDPIRRKFGLELFGLDFLVDSQFRPWLLEINTNPCLQLCSPVLQRLIPRMMENMFRLCVDPLFRPDPQKACSKNEAYYLYDESFLDRNKFSLLFDEQYDRNFEWEERCQKVRGIEWSDSPEEQYPDEGTMISLDY